MSSWPCAATPVPASERPTVRAIPRAPRVPAEFCRDPVEAVRYDLANATGYALRHAGFDGSESDGCYDGMGLGDGIMALAEARCDLISAAEKLGRR